MTINDLILKLIQKTKEDKIEWTSPSKASYRYLTDTGAVTITNHSNQFYEIRLFDIDTCFASYQTLGDLELNRLSKELYMAITDSFNREIERKIGTIFESL